MPPFSLCYTLFLVERKSVLDLLAGSEIVPMFIQFVISRFALPAGGIDGITLRTTFKLTVPFEFLAASSKLEVSIPFTYDFDSGE